MKTIQQIKEEHTYSKPCCVSDSPNAATVWMKVGSQHFCVTHQYLDTDEEVEWTRKMLAIALYNFAVENL